MTNILPLLVYLVYGLVFLHLGGVMYLHARSDVKIFPVGALWLLAAFGITHGFHEWLHMFELLQSQGNLTLHPSLELLSIVLLPVSFILLLAFSVEILVEAKLWPTWLRTLCILLPTIAFLVIAERPDAEKIARKAFAIPAAFLSAYAVYSFSRTEAIRLKGRILRCLRASSIIFIVYGLAAGLVDTPGHEQLAVSPHAVFPILFRMVSALALGFFLSEAFVVEVSKLENAIATLRQEFVAVIAHDLRSVVSGIDLAAQTIQQRKDLNEKAKSELMEGILGNAKMLYRLISDFSAATLIEIGKLKLRQEKQDLKEIVEESVRQAQAQIGDRKVHVALPSGSVWAEVDRDRIKQVIFNLLTNAAKYSYEGSEILVQLLDNGKEAEIKVVNQGDGINERQIPFLFQRFQRAGDSSRQKGTGLGLHIVKGFVEAHGGRVGVKSVPGGTTTFCVKLPAQGTRE
jgi:signal transduction histidine kinase